MGFLCLILIIFVVGTFQEIQRKKQSKLCNHTNLRLQYRLGCDIIAEMKSLYRTIALSQGYFDQELNLFEIEQECSYNRKSILKSVALYYSLPEYFIGNSYSKWPCEYKRLSDVVIRYTQCKIETLGYSYKPIPYTSPYLYEDTNLPPIDSDCDFWNKFDIFMERYDAPFSPKALSLLNNRAKREGDKEKNLSILKRSNKDP